MVYVPESLESAILFAPMVGGFDLEAPSTSVVMLELCNPAPINAVLVE